LAECVEQARTIDETVLIEQRILGADVTCGVVEVAGGGGGAGTDPAGYASPDRIHRVVCPPTLIRPLKGTFFDYESKYRPGASEEITPAPLEKETLQIVQEVADRAHVILGCSGLSRTDLMVTESGEVVFLETNTLPGMTMTSLLPQGARAIGLDMTQLLSALVDAGLAAARARDRAWRRNSVSC